MNRKTLPAFLFVALFTGALGLYKFSNGVRTVDVLGLFASGFACGAAFVWLIKVLRRKS
jgi:hypothetical protein